MKFITLIILILIVNIKGIRSQNVKNDLSLKLQQISKVSTIRGFGVAVFNQDSVLYSKGFGFSDESKKTPYSVHTVQKIASISKILLGVSLMKAVELKLLALDDDVNLYLPFTLKNPHVMNDVITVRHLATHTSALKKSKKDIKALYFPTKIGKVYKEMSFGLQRLIFRRMVHILNSNEDLPLDQFLYKIYDPKGEWYTKSSFDKSPAGSKFIYSNNGASLLALIIERVSGMKYSEFVRTHILEPLKMKDSYFDFESGRNKDLSRSELFHAGIKIPNDYRLILYPAGGLETNVIDFAKYMSAMIEGFMQGNEILAHSSFSEMMSPQVHKRFNQGILWDLQGDYIGHNGDIAGATTVTFFDKKKGVGYLLFCNTAMTATIDEDIEMIKSLLRGSIDEF